MSTQNYANSPLKSCETCAYLRPDTRHQGYNQVRFAQCARYNSFANTAQNCQCTDNLNEWRPAPPKPTPRSIRQRLYDYWLA